MSLLVERLLAQWRAIGARERVLVAIAGTLFLLILAQLLWRGGSAAIADLRADVAALREANAIARSLEAAPPTAARSDLPLLTLAERSAREVGIGNALKRLDGGDGGRVRARLEGAPFGTVVRWLAAVQSGSGATIESLVLERGADPGVVEASIVIAPAAP